MASIYQFLLYFLRQFRLTKGSIHRCIKRWVLFLAFLGRRVSINYLWHDGTRGASHKPLQAERSPSRTGARLELGECVVAASQVPASASHPSLHDVAGATGQLQTIASSRASSPASIGAEPHRDHAHPTTTPGMGIYGNLSSASLSTHSRASDRLSILQQRRSRESLHAPIDQTSRFYRAPHRQFGRGPSPSPSRERPSRSPSPPGRVHPLPRLEFDTTNLHHTHVDVRISPINPPSTVAHTHERSPPSLHGRRRGQPSTSVVVGIETLSTESLPLSPLENQQPQSDDPYTIGSPIEEPSREGSPEHSPTSSSPSATFDFELPAGRIFQLINSEQVPRYTKEVTVPRERTYYEIPPLTTTFLHVSEHSSFGQGSLKEGCAPWVPATHPDGALYFYDRDRRLFTDSDMYNPILREEMEDFYLYLDKIVRHDKVVIPSTNYDLVLDIMPSDDGRQMQWSYYYACHETRCLFWLDSYDATYMTSELFGVQSPAHVKHRLEDLYWTHWYLFPVVFEGRRLEPAVYDELVGILSHGSMDVMTSKSSTHPYDLNTMQHMIGLVHNAKGGSDTGLVYHTAAITRLLSVFAHWRFLYFHGQHSARLERHKTVYTNSGQQRTWLITFFSPLLFLAPESYLRDLEILWRDEIIIEAVWKHFMNKLLDEWADLILWSTVMLTANVGFLAIPGVVISNINSNMTKTSDLHIYTSASQIVSCMSAEASVGSIVIGMLLVRHHRTVPRQDPAGASTYLYQNSHRIFGLEPIAIIFGLPWALLMWAMVTFSIALLLFCFSISNPLTRIFAAVTSVMVTVLIGWCIRRDWGYRDERRAWISRLIPYAARALERVHVACYDIFGMILRRGSPPSSSFPYGHSGSSHAIPDARVNV